MVFYLENKPESLQTEAEIASLTHPSFTSVHYKKSETL